jgi:hypothetical protein
MGELIVDEEQPDESKFLALNSILPLYSDQKVIKNLLISAESKYLLMEGKRETVSPLLKLSLNQIFRLAWPMQTWMSSVKRSAKSRRSMTSFPSRRLFKFSKKLIRFSVRSFIC